MGFRDKLKNLGGKAKDKSGDAFTALKQKWSKPEVRPGEEGIANLGTFLNKTSKDILGKEYGRGGKPSIIAKSKIAFGKAKTKYNEWDKKRSEAARIEKYATVKKCPKCGQMHTGAEPCPATGKPEPTSDQKEEAMERIREEYTGKKSIGLNTRNIGKKIGGIIASGITVAVLYGASFIYRPDIAQTTLIIGVILVAFIAISMFVKGSGVGKVLTLSCFAVIAFALYYTHTADTMTSQIIAYAEPVLGPVYDQSMELIDKGIAFFQCTFGMTAGMDLEACIESRTTNKTQENVNKLGPVETLELNWGRNIEGKYDYDLPEQDLPYTLDITLVNKNQKIYRINITDIKASTTSTKSGSTTPILIPGSYYKQYEEYILEPKEELPVRIKFNGAPSDPTINGIGECKSSKTFDVNISTRQTSGGWSDFGFSPSDEDTHKKFVHAFKPSITAEPGPLNIYVFTDPYVIVTDENNFKQGDQFEVVIKIQNTVKTGIANISELILVQEFEIPDRLFNINEITCHFTSGLKPSETTNVLDPAFPGCDCEYQGGTYKCNQNCEPGYVGKDCTGYLYNVARPVPQACNSSATSGPGGTSGTGGTFSKERATDRCPGSNNNCLRLKFAPPLTIKPNRKITISCNATVSRLTDNEYTDQIRVYANFNYTQEWSKVIPCLI